MDQDQMFGLSLLIVASISCFVGIEFNTFFSRRWRHSDGYNVEGKAMSSMKVIGFEGRHPTDAQALTWAVAAIRLPDGVRNSMSRRLVRDQELQDLSMEGHLTLLNPEVEISDTLSENPLLVIVLRKNLPSYATLKLDKSETKYISGHREGEVFDYLIAQEGEQFNWYVGLIRARILRTFTEQSRAIEPSVLEAGLTLDSTDPYLNAISVLVERTNPERVAEIAEGNVSDDDKEEYEKFLAACRSTAQYVLKYEDGGVKVCRYVKDCAKDMDSNDPAPNQGKQDTNSNDDE